MTNVKHFELAGNENVVVNVSLVLYKTSIELVKKAIFSVLNSVNVEARIILIDNSPTNELEALLDLDKRIEYIFNNSNVGYGRAHNIALRRSMANGVEYHLILNPDVYFDSDALFKLIRFMQDHKNIGNLMPKVLYPSGSFQYLCKLLPTPADWLGRFVSNFLNFSFLKKRNDRFEMRFSDFDQILEVPYLSGCFMLLRTSILMQAGLFDENIFLHTEDVDLSRRVFERAKSIYYPYVSIFHDHNREAYRNCKLMLMQIRSMFYYFNKWGWFFDRNRSRINSAVIFNKGRAQL